MLIFLGFNLTFFPQFILGYLGMPRRYHAYPPEFQVLNVLSSAGATILAVGLSAAAVLSRLVAVPRRARAGQSVGRDRARMADAVAAAEGEFRRDADRDLGAVRLPSAAQAAARPSRRAAGSAMSELIAPSAHAEFQYPSAEHQSKTAISGMWLFLATELLFFGALFYLWMMLRRWHLAGFDAAAREPTC